MTRTAAELMIETQDSLRTAQTVVETIDNVVCPWCYSNELKLHVSRGLMTILCGLGACRFRVTVTTKDE